MMRMILVMIFLFSWGAQAQQAEVQNLFKQKEYAQLADYYLQNKNLNYSKQDYVIISFALRKSGKWREDIGLNARLVKKLYSAEHKKLMADSRASNTIDPDEYSNSQKVLYWLILSDYVYIIKGYKAHSQALDKDVKHFQTFSKILSDLEFRESKVDRLNNQVNSHLQYLSDVIYHWVGSLSFNYVSWQRKNELTGDGNRIGLSITNRGYCIGGDAGMENYRWHFYVDGCFLLGSGGVKSEAGASPDYQQSNVPAYGIKAGPGVSMIVSSSKSRIGIKLPMIYSTQKYTNPRSTTTNTAYTIKEVRPIEFLTSLYSRFQFEKWYIQTEFGQYVQNDNIFWGIGVGRQF